jgi:hypothetical protein
MTAEHEHPVVHLASFRLARRAADVLRDLLHDPAWLISLNVEIYPTGHPVVVATVRRRTREVCMCFPSSVDDVRVVVREVGQADGSTRGGR